MFPVVTLSRKYLPDCTQGIATLPSGKQIKTIEPPWLDNKANVSCYPEGAYLVKWLPRSASGKYKRVWHVQNVPDRVGILWHIGNLVSHTQGCTLTGLKHGWLGNERAVLSSGAGMNRMRSELAGKDFILIVSS